VPPIWWSNQCLCLAWYLPTVTTWQTSLWAQDSTHLKQPATPNIISPSETRPLRGSYWYKEQVELELKAFLSIGGPLSRAITNLRWSWWVPNQIYHNSKFSNSNIKLQRLRCMKRWYSPNRRPRSQQLATTITRRRSCLQPLETPSIPPVKSEATHSRHSSNSSFRIRQSHSRLILAKWTAHRASFSHELLM
jgi:hypothetical protein